MIRSTGLIAFFVLAVSTQAFSQPPVVVRPRVPNQDRLVLESWVGKRLRAHDVLSVREVLGLDRDVSGMSVESVRLTAYQPRRGRSTRVSVALDRHEVISAMDVFDRPMSFVIQLNARDQRRALDVDLRTIEILAYGELFIESLQVVLNTNGQRREVGRIQMSRYTSHIQHGEPEFWLEDLFEHPTLNPLDRVTLRLLASRAQRGRDGRRDRGREHYSWNETARVEVCSTDDVEDCSVIELPLGREVETSFHFNESFRNGRRGRETIDVRDLSMRVLEPGSAVSINGAVLVEQSVRRDHERDRRDDQRRGPRRGTDRRRNCERHGNVVIC